MTEPVSITPQRSTILPSANRQISIVDGRNPYRGAHIRGRVAETVEGDDALEIIDRLAVKYTGDPFPMRSGIVYVIDAERARFAELPFRHEARE